MIAQVVRIVFASVLVVAGALVMMVVMGGPATAAVLLTVAGVWAARRFWVRSGLAAGSPPSAPAEPVVADMSTVELCAAWRQSYFELLRAVDGPVRERLVGLRQEYLDELERRDSTRFALWLASGARAGTDPRRYLAFDS